MKGGIEARPGHTEVRGEPEPQELSRGPDGSRDLSATENRQLPGHVIVSWNQGKETPAWKYAYGLSSTIICNPTKAAHNFSQNICIPST